MKKECVCGGTIYPVPNCEGLGECFQCKGGFKYFNDRYHPISKELFRQHYRNVLIEIQKSNK